jgi:hypothetical protein
VLSYSQGSEKGKRGAKMSILHAISSDLSLDTDYVSKLAKTSAASYREIYLKNGRRVWQPSAELKLLQYWVIDFIVNNDLRENPHATAYEKGCSIQKNAAIHCKNRHFLRLDIQNFFPSIKKELLQRYFSGLDLRGYMLTENDYSLLFSICLFRGGLTIGSPSSPYLANRVMRPIDQEIVECVSCYDKKAKYSRYSDDIFVSSKRFLSCNIPNEVSRILARHDLRLNMEKTNFMGPGDRRKLAGVVIDHKNNLSLGSKRKELLKRKVYSLMTGKLSARHDIQQLLGLIYFCKSVDPEFVNRMMLKYSAYGGSVISKIHSILAKS